MKKLSDYKGEEAIELWGELLEPVAVILSDAKVSALAKNRKERTRLQFAAEIVRLHKKEVARIFEIIDPDVPVDGFNVIIHLANILAELGSNPELQSFFGFAEQGDTENEFTGSATENTGDGAN